jgi:protein-disulfide isomerase
MFDRSKGMVMQLNPTTVAAAAVSSLVTLCVAILVIAFGTNAFRDPGLSNLQRAEIASLIKDHLGEGADRAAKAVREQPLSEAQRSEIARAVRQQLRDNPQIMQEALTELIRKRVPSALGTAAATPPSSPDKSALIKSNAAVLFASAHQVTIGNPQGDVTMVEFFDYNCGYCKRALSDTLELLKSDPQLKIVLKEFPILGPGSIEAAKVAVAVRMQDTTGTKYLEFHEKLLASSAPANKANALSVAQEVGLDIERLQKDIDGDEVRQTLDENLMLARNLGINGTPGYVIGETIVPGAIGAAALKEKILAARNRRPG